MYNCLNACTEGEGEPLERLVLAALNTPCAVVSVRLFSEGVGERERAQAHRETAREERERD